MVFDISVAISWILFLALFPIAYFWLRRAWHIFAHRDFSEVALKRGEPPEEAHRYAPYTGLINLICGVVILFVIFGVLVLGLPFENWSAAAGITIWGKFIADLILSRHAHLLRGSKQS